MSKVVRLSNITIEALENYRDLLSEHYEKLTNDYLVIEAFTNLDYNGLIQTALKSISSDLIPR